MTVERGENGGEMGGGGGEGREEWEGEGVGWSARRGVEGREWGEGWWVGVWVGVCGCTGLCGPPKEYLGNVNRHAPRLGNPGRCWKMSWKMYLFPREYLEDVNLIKQIKLFSYLNVHMFT